MNVERTATFKKDYKALNAASKMRVEIALGRLLDGREIEIRTVDFIGGIEAALLDEFLCITFERIPEGIRLLNVRSADLGSSKS